MNTGEMVRIIYEENGKEQITKGYVTKVKKSKTFIVVEGKEVPYSNIQEVVIHIYGDDRRFDDEGNEI